MNANRLVIAKVELAEACERRDVADLELRSASCRHSVGEMLTAARRKRQAREVIGRLLKEISELEAAETAVEANFGPEATEGLS